ncbi:O-antigen ligase family protein [Candidatus Uhrbacteria bacterium]|nr:O-antigen ligase family protein [Candidatus Uhrbacteria bacterium]
MKFAPAFSICWRLAVLALPWQTRWFSDATLAGWPWEQGRLSFYVSWVFILATILIRPPIKMNRSAHIDGWRRLPLFFLLTATFLATAFDPSAMRAVGQWWLQVFLLVFFCVTIIRSGVSARQIATWTAISLIPHVALGYWQYAIQNVIGHPWLGIATQLPELPGVSVVEHGAYRVLRMYGGFPHPNIFGGWLAVGLLLSIWLAATASTKWRALAWSCCSAAMSVALLLTYARGAWIAVVVGFIALVIGHIRTNVRTSSGVSFSLAAVALVCSMIAVGIVGYSQRDHLLARFDPSARLEAKSLESRAASLEEGWKIFRRHPFFGTGPNAELLELAASSKQHVASAPLEPPHNTFLLALVDLGLIGVLLLIIFLSPHLFKHPPPTTHLLACLLILSLFDHYPWSTWSGQALVAIIFSLTLATKKPLGLPTDPT